MLKIFLPDQYVKSVYSIKPENLIEKGIKGIIIDLDNTLVAWNEPHADENVYTWFKEMEESGLEITIISNNNKSRVELFSKPLKRPYVYHAKKPLKGAFIRATKQMGFDRDEVVVIGDQLLTDVLGGNRAGLKTILVVPIVESDDKITYFNRKIERIILNKFKKQGLLKWED